MRKDGLTGKHTDMTKLIVAFCNFANAPKNDITFRGKKLPFLTICICFHNQGMFHELKTLEFR
jgi:hypothetical protein